MRRVCTVFRSLHVMLATACMAAAALPAAADGGKARDARAGEASRRLPLAFEANKGQADSRVKFLARGARNTLFLTEREAVLSLAGREGSPAESLRMTFLAGNANARINGVDQLPGKTNYLIGKNPAAWHIGVSSYGAVRYERIYRGVDLVFHGSDERQLEYDFIVDPGADPRVIRLRFEGASRLSIDASGNLVISMAGGDLIERAPVAYQEIDGVRRPVAARYELHGKNEVAFRVARYDRRQPLTIDPVLIYSTFLGGSSTEQASGVAVDGSGSAYVTGVTSSLDFPATNKLWPLDPAAKEQLCVLGEPQSPVEWLRVRDQVLSGGQLADLLDRVWAGLAPWHRNRRRRQRVRHRGGVLGRPPDREPLPGVIVRPIAELRRVRHQTLSRWRRAGVLHVPGRIVR